MEGHHTSSPALWNRAVILATGHLAPEKVEAIAPHPSWDKPPVREQNCTKGKLHVCSHCVHTGTSVIEVN